MFLETDGRSRSKSRRSSGIEVVVLGDAAIDVAEGTTEMGSGSGSGSGAGRVKVCGGVLVLLGCFFVVVM